MLTKLRTAITCLEQGLEISDEDRDALMPCDDVPTHWHQVQDALTLCRAETEKVAEADDVKPLAELSVDACDMWVYLQLAKRIGALRTHKGGGAPCVGICAPTGAGKSTLVQLLKALLERVLHVGRVVEVSLDDFLSSQQERRERGIRTRWDINSTNEEFAPLLGELKHAADASAMVELPMFNKARDERLVSTRKVAGPVAVVLFEGWRVGVEHPNFFGFNEHVDMLVSLTADLEAIFVQKSEAAARGVASSKVDMYAQYGGFGAVVDNYYRPIAQSLIAPVLEWSDVVLEMGGVPHHRVEGVTWRPGRWRAHQAATCLEELPAVVVGGGQAGLCCSYHLQARRHQPSRPQPARPQLARPVSAAHPLFPTQAPPFLLRVAAKP